MQGDDQPRAKSHIPRAKNTDTTGFAAPRRSNYGIEVSHPPKENPMTSGQSSNRNRALEKEHNSIMMESMNRKLQKLSQNMI